MKETVFAAATSVAIVGVVTWVVLRRRPTLRIGEFAPLVAAAAGIVALMIAIDLFLPRGPEVVVAAAIGFALSAILLYFAWQSGPGLSTPESRWLAFLALAGVAFVVLRLLHG